MDFWVSCAGESSLFSEAISKEIREEAGKPVADGTSEVLLIVRVVLGRVVAGGHIYKGQGLSLLMSEAMDANYYSTVVKAARFSRLMDQCLIQDICPNFRKDIQGLRSRHSKNACVLLIDAFVQVKAERHKSSITSRSGVYTVRC